MCHIFQILNPPTTFHDVRYTPESNFEYFLYSVTTMEGAHKLARWFHFVSTRPVYSPVLSVFVCCAISVIDHLAVDSAFEWTRTELTWIIKLLLLFLLSLFRQDIPIGTDFATGWTPEESWFDSGQREETLFSPPTVAKIRSGPKPTCNSTGKGHSVRG